MVLTIIVLVNVISNYVYHRFDFTEEKRYSLTDPTKELVSTLEDVVYVKVYLEGKMPAEYERLKNETKEILNELRVNANGNLEYEFIDLTEITDEEERSNVYRELYRKGIDYVDVGKSTIDASNAQTIWPGAIVAYKEQETVVNLLKTTLGAGDQDVINNSIQQLEYGFASAIHKLATPIKTRVGFVEGHGELEKMYVADIVSTLREQYLVNRVRINGDLESLRVFRTIVIAKPDSSFSEADKFIIDQFIMKGGRVLWLVDGVFASMDSLQTSPSGVTMGIAQSVNIEDQFFKYGVRINPNLVLDIRSRPIPLVTGYVANQPKQEFFPWFYQPLLVKDVDPHPIVKNIEAVCADFISVMDTIGVPKVKKTILLTSSKYSKIQTTPARISFNILRVPPDEKQFNQQYLPVAVLMEGTFESVFKNRKMKALNDYAKTYVRKDTSAPTKQIFIADGDIIKNRIDTANNRYYKLGIDKFTGRSFGNKDFLLNCINYLCDDSGLIQSRSKEFKIRLLDSERIVNEKAYWQFVNIVIPMLVVLVLGIIQVTLRKRKFSKTK